jgi:uncharacterized cupin superfamily protein
MRISYDGDPIEDRPEASLVRFVDADVVDREANEIGSSDHRVWYYAFPEARWLSLATLTTLEPGASTSFRSHGTETDGPIERTYRILSGTIELRTEYGDERLRSFDTVFCPTNAAHQFRNGGTERCWIASWASGSDGTAPLELTETPPEERPGYIDEYERVMAARRERDPSLPSLDERSSMNTEAHKGPSPEIQRFAGTYPVKIPGSDRVGASGRPTWFLDFDSERFHTGSLLKLEPGEQVAFHSHLPENEGPLEDVYWVFESGAKLRTEYWDEHLSRYDVMHFPPGTAHQLRNAGTETLWFGSWTSVGDEAATFELDPTEGFAPEDRPGYVAEYDRIMAARSERGLSLPPEVEGQ